MKKRGIIWGLAAVVIVVIVAAPAGNECDSSSPCTCGVPCQGQFDPLSNGDNTIDICTDGTYPKYEWVEDITVTDQSDSTFRPGHILEIDATFKCDEGEGDEVSINYHNGTAWRVVNNGSCNVAAFVHFVNNITLDYVVGTHAVRAVIAWKGVSTGMICGYNYDTKYSDTDDITFQVAEPADSSAPNITALLYPGDGASHMTLAVDFNFSVSDASVIVNCSLWINSSSGFSLNTTITSVLNNKSMVNTISKDTPDGSYLWNIQCFDEGGFEGWFGSNYSFSVDAGTPVMTYMSSTPADGSYLNITTAVINLTVADPNLDDMLLEWNGTNESGALAYAGNDIWTALKIFIAGQYGFRVFANDTFGNSNATTLRTVVFDTVPPAAFDLLEPTNGSQATAAPELAPLLNWTTTTDGFFKNYTIEVSDSQSFAYANYTYSVTGGAGTSHYEVTSNWGDNTQWYWRVTAFDYTGNARRSTNDHVYTTSVQAPAVLLVSPSDGSYSRQSSISFTYVPDDNNLDLCTLWTNSTGAWQENSTNTSPVDNQVNTFGPLSFAEGSFIWNVLCNDTTSQESWAPVNNSVIIDWTAPVLSFSAGTPADSETVANHTIQLYLAITEMYPDYLIVTWNGTNNTISFGQGSSYVYNKTVSTDGYYNFLAHMNDSAGNLNATEQREILVDTTAPLVINMSVLPSTARPFQTFNITAHVSDMSAVSYVYAEIAMPNLTALNVSCTGLGGILWSCTYNASANGNYSIRTYTSDSNGWTNSTGILANFSVDSTPVLITNVSYSPSDQDALDPNVPVAVASVVTAVLNVSTVLLQYKEVNDSLWTAVTMTMNGSVASSNFTPSRENNWSFRVWANNTLGTTNHSDTTTIPVWYDRTWQLSPADLGSIAKAFGLSGVSIGNFTINVTGETSLVFNVSQYSGTVDVNSNASDLLSVSSRQSTVVLLTADIPVVEGSYPAVLRVDALNAVSNPSESQVNLTVISYSSGSYVLTTITQYDSTVSPGGVIQVLKVRLQNIGNETCTSTNLTWLVPTDWTSRDDLEYSLGTLNIGSTVWNNISLDVPSSAASGSYTVTAQATCASGAAFNDSRTVTVSSGSQQQTPPPGGSGSSSGGSIVQRLEYLSPSALDITVPETVSAHVGTTVLVNVSVRNTLSGTEFHNISLSTSGYFTIHTNITQPQDSYLAPGEVMMIHLTFDVPPYVSPDAYNVELTLSARAIDNTLGGEPSLVKSTKSLMLIVTAVTREQVLVQLDTAHIWIQEVVDLGIDPRKAQEYVTAATDLYDRGSFDDASRLLKELEQYAATAQALADALRDTEEHIVTSERNGMDMVDARQLLQLAQKEYQSGNLEKAMDMLEKSLLAERIQAKTEEAKLISRSWYFIRNHLLLIIAVMLALSGVGVVTVQYLHSRDVERKLEITLKQEQHVLDDIKGLQKEHYVERLLGPQMYTAAMQRLRKRTAEIQHQKIKLISLRRSRLRRPDMRTLEAEKRQLRELLTELHSKYYLHRTLSHDGYVQLKKLCEERLSGILEELKLHEKDRVIHNTQEEPQEGKAAYHVPHTKEPAQNDTRVHAVYKEVMSERAVESSVRKMAKHPFYGANGRTAASLQELREMIEEMSAEDFAHHVTASKNDFSYWIRHSLDIYDLPEHVSGERSKEGVIRVIDNFIKG
jgi:tetratricopeptide (TPR) repeat protein